jgi:iron complex transport system permease protein
VKKTGAPLALCCALLAVSLCSLLIGSVRFTPEDLYSGVRFLLSGSGNEIAALVIFQIRLPRIVLACATGASLGIAGAGFQALFRNPLADPFIMGTSSGAALGAGLAMMFPLPFLPAISPAAFAGSLAAVLLAWIVSRAAGNQPSAVSLLLAGASISALFSSLLSFLLIIKDGNLQRVYYWLLGSLAGATWQTALPILPVMFFGCLVITLCSRGLDLLLQGDEAAESLGLDVKSVRLTVIIGASLAVAAAVCAAGVIGFVGLAAPHSARLLAGPVHRRLIPLSALTGALLTAAADTFARSIAPPLEIPVGIITALAGAPFFLYLLSKRRWGLGE